MVSFDYRKVVAFKSVAAKNYGLVLTQLKSNKTIYAFSGLAIGTPLSAPSSLVDFGDNGWMEFIIMLLKLVRGNP